MTDEELDALVKQAMDRAIERLQKLHDYAGRPAWDQVLREELSGPITTLRAQLAEAAKLAAAGNLIALELRVTDGAIEEQRARADRAEAALAAQIEADAEICDGMHSSTIYYEAHECANAIRNQPHDRTALDRYREKVLREVLEKAKASFYGVITQDAILAQIEKPVTQGGNIG